MHGHRSVLNGNTKKEFNVEMSNGTLSLLYSKRGPKSQIKQNYDLNYKG